MTTAESPLIERLQEMLQAAAQDVNLAAGGRALCKVSSTGIQGQSVKYFEGRWAALREVDRGVHEGKDPNAIPVIRAIHSQWTSEYERHVANGSGASWVHYSAGGVDALSELLDG